MNTTPSFSDNTTEYAPWVAKYGLRYPYGECQCGCGRAALIAPSSWAKMGIKQHHPYRFLKGHGNRGRHRAIIPIEQRFWKKVDKRGPNDCWEWMGCKDKLGYGHLGVGGRNDGQIGAHRFSYELHYGPIPDGLCVCHNCPDGDNPACCNPAHLWLGTSPENTADMVRKGRSAKGEDHSQSKFTEDDVRRIRALSQQGMSQGAIARLYGMNQGHIGSIVNRKSWTHVP